MPPALAAPVSQCTVVSLQDPDLRVQQQERASIIVPWSLSKPQVPSLHSLVLGGTSAVPMARPDVLAPSPLQPLQPLQLPPAGPANRQNVDKVRRTVYISDIDPVVSRPEWPQTLSGSGQECCWDK